MPKLHLKRTSAEEEERLRRKARKAARKACRPACSQVDISDEDVDRGYGASRGRRRSASPVRSGRFGANGNGKDDYNEKEYGPFPADPGPSSSGSRSRADYEADAEFDAKMRDALADDGLYDPLQRLDGVEARLNSYAHIPRRWRGTEEGFSAGLWMADAQEEIGLQPWQMNDDEYAEYMRAGMWRKKHAAEYTERLRKKEEREARRKREHALHEETKRLEREAKAEREARRIVRARRRIEEARRLYEEMWLTLLARHPEEDNSEERSILSFQDIPWPVAPPSSEAVSISPEDISLDAISAFLLPSTEAVIGDADTAPSAKDILRATMLRFHPDKFESRVLSQVQEKDREQVKEAAGVVVRALNALLKEYADKAAVG